ncbi:MAG: NTP transferase domain-containing protein [Planctomycetota bacterium]
MGRAATVVVLAAGQGTRMKTAGPKVLHPLCGRPVLGYVLDQARSLDPAQILVVVGHGGEAVRTWIEGAEPDARIRCVPQAEQLGTAHALRQCLPALSERPGPVVVLYGDMPLLRSESLAALCQAKERARAAAITATPRRSRGFGRIRRENGEFRGIVEEKDATPAELAIREVNVGVYAFAREDLVLLLPRLENRNAQGEYYLTDLPGRIVAHGGTVATVTLADENEAIGINDLSDLSEARAVVQERIHRAHLAAGVFLEDPATTYIDHGVEIGPGTRILPCTVIRAGVKIGAGCEVGPFTHLRPGTVLEDGAELGNFTEAKKAIVGKGTKAKHLTYLGDVRIGANANIGAGTIVANYDGKRKNQTDIGDRAFIGSGTVLIAPCRVGEGALTGGGAIVTKHSDIPPGDVWVGIPAKPLRSRKNAASREGGQAPEA